MDEISIPYTIVYVKKYANSENKKGLQSNETLYCASDPDWIQTNDLLLRRQLLYSTELPDQKITTKNFTFINRNSTNDLPD